MPAVRPVQAGAALHEPHRSGRKEGTMITIGIDAYKHLHVATALDAAGRELDRWEGPNSPDGWAALLAWGAAMLVAALAG